MSETIPIFMEFVDFEAVLLPFFCMSFVTRKQEAMVEFSLLPPQGCDGLVVHGGNFVQVGNTDIQVLQESIG